MSLWAFVNLVHQKTKRDHKIKIKSKILKKNDAFSIYSLRLYPQLFIFLQIDLRISIIINQANNQTFSVFQTWLLFL